MGSIHSVIDSLTLHHKDSVPLVVQHSVRGTRTKYMEQEYKPPTHLSTDPLDDGSYRKKCNDNTIIIPVDRGCESMGAFLFYVEHLHRPDNEVHLIHCCEHEHPSGENYPDYAVPPEQFSIMMDTPSMLTEDHILQPYKKLMRKHQISGKAYCVYSGRPGRAILDTATDIHASHIVMGSRGLGPLARAMLGSVSDYVVTKSEIPVTVVRSNKNIDVMWYFLH